MEATFEEMMEWSGLCECTYDSDRERLDASMLTFMIRAHDDAGMRQGEPETR